jgi:DnaA-homolog protein
MTHRTCCISPLTPNPVSADRSARSGQIPLAVQLEDDASFDNFYLPSGSRLAALIAGLRAPLGRQYYIHGPSGSGVTHLLWASMCHTRGVQAQYVPLAEFRGEGPLLLDSLPLGGLVCFDDLDAVTHSRDWQLALFDFFNRQQQQGGGLIFGSHTVPARLQVDLADLRSRLLGGEVWQLDRLNDEGRAAALALRARIRGFELEERVIQYLLTRGDRCMNALMALLGHLDHASLQEQRRITMGMVTRILQYGDREVL